jgi:hypothetical protein
LDAAGFTAALLLRDFASASHRQDWPALRDELIEEGERGAASALRGSGIDPGAWRAPIRAAFRPERTVAGAFQMLAFSSNQERREARLGLLGLPI